MADDYDSESSSGSYTETSVLLGYASRSDELDTISKLGGQPDWLEGAQPASVTLARCGACQDIMVLLLQLNGELPERFPGHERRLYVFACRRKSCRRREGSVRVVRAVRAWGGAKEEEEEEEEEEEAVVEMKKDRSGLGEALFGASTTVATDVASSNPFAVPSISAPSTSSSLTKTFAQSLSLNNDKDEVSSSSSTSFPPSSRPRFEAWPSQLPKPYPTYSLSDADYEILEPTTAAKLPPQARLVDSSDELPSALDREAFESTMDATFQKFADRIAQNPDQVLRYHFAGLPLLYSDKDAVGRLLAGLNPPGFPACRHCAGPRCFELQLTPNAIVELEAGELGFDGMEWGTIIVAVCERDCVPNSSAEGEVQYLEEWAGVQWEELVNSK
ncbi:hypothetical protein XA68_10431 [Ophiocordyceps unilateralis]|uniref:Programmed cell death protein 2 C-terminal domain-containing protein n=1 Tax=Ophiocordyceps unilateralis TaxID=268505 RepID=A0A2A9PNS0_OPHUN|nr:hypothetical protein XA68_10431 [Ophiocordyceps unilateralis]